MKFSDNYVIFSPRRGIKKYITLSVILSLTCNFITLLLFVIFGKGAADWLSFQALMLAPTFAAMLEIVFAGFNMWGIASNDSKRNSFLRTIPDMEKIIKNALVCDEIKRIALCVMTCGISCIITAVFGFYKMEYIIPAYIYQTALMYIIITVGGYIIKRIKKGSTQTAVILVYIWLIVGNSGNIFTAEIITEMTVFSVNVLLIAAIYAIAAAVGTVCFRSVLKRSLASRYADREIKEGT